MNYLQNQERDVENFANTTYENINQYFYHFIIDITKIIIS